MFQNFNLFPQYTALQNVTLARELLSKERGGETKEEIEAAGRELLAQMGLADRAGHYPHQLSGGQQQRVAIARALALHPDILCFDEPTSALDPELTGEVLRVIRNLAEQKTTMIIVTHEMAFARDVADQVIFMDGGVIVEQGDPHQVIDHPREERTRQFLSRLRGKLILAASAALPKGRAAFFASGSIGPPQAPAVLATEQKSARRPRKRPAVRVWFQPRFRGISSSWSRGRASSPTPADWQQGWRGWWCCSALPDPRRFPAFPGTAAPGTVPRRGPWDALYPPGLR